jgi:hypothetical protein
MRLYAKIKSDRAETGQGGNKWLNIPVMVGSTTNSREIALIRLEVVDNGYRLEVKTSKEDFEQFIAE